MLKISVFQCMLPEEQSTWYLYLINVILDPALIIPLLLGCSMSYHNIHLQGHLCLLFCDLRWRCKT